MAEDRRPQQHTDTAATLTSSLSFFGWRLVCPLIRAPFPGSADNPGEEVVGRLGSQPTITRPSWICQWFSPPDCPASHTGGAASITQEEMKSHPIKGVILVSEAFTEAVDTSEHPEKV